MFSFGFRGKIVFPLFSCCLVCGFFVFGVFFFAGRLSAAGETCFLCGKTDVVVDCACCPTTVVAITWYLVTFYARSMSVESL